MAEHVRGRERRQQLDVHQEIESQAIAATLDTGQWTLEGRRHRIFVLVSGTGELSQRGEVVALEAPSLVWVPEGQSARLTLAAGARGADLAISDAVLGQASVPGNIAEGLRRLTGRPHLGMRIERAAAERLTALVTTMGAELSGGGPGAQELIRHQLAIVCMLLWRAFAATPSAVQPTPGTIVGKFLQLVEQQSRHHWSVAQYASYLGVSIDRLNAAVRRATGRSPLAIVHGRLFDEAKQMIEGSDLQIAEVASLLGFDDPAYFSRFFKRVGGRSPRQCRLEYASSLAQANRSFAAWP